MYHISNVPATMELRSPTCCLRIAIIFLLLASPALTKTLHPHGTIEEKYHLLLNTEPEDFDIPHREETAERWMVDEIDYPDYDYQGDAPHPSKGDDAKCPPYPEKAPARACKARECKADKDCRRHNQRCCFNGCKFTCTLEMTQPAVLDWQLEPRRQSHADTPWLIKGPVEDDGVEPCTTTKEADDGDPLLCPHAYVCHIVDPGDPKAGVPNRGKCIKENTKEEDIRSRKKILKADLRGSGMCLLGTTIIRDRTVILRGDEQEKCICQKGTIKCGDRFLSYNSAP